MEYSQRIEHCQPGRRGKVDGWWNSVQRILWPPTCVLCCGAGTAGRDLCAACEADLPINRYACALCAQPLAPTIEPAHACGACQRRPPHFDASFAPYRYLYPIDRLIQRLKYARQLSVGRVLGELFARQLRGRGGPLPELIVPVPLAAGRFRSRGYNQAIELGSHVSRRSGIELRTDLVVRAHETQEQAGLARKERRRNVRGAFRLRCPLPRRHIAILDDVVTTGSTANELAKVLRRAGAERIEVWAIAKAGK